MVAPTEAGAVAMENPKNSLKAALASGKVQFGLWMSGSDPMHVEMLAGQGFDWLVIDTEHAPTPLPAVGGLLQAVAPYPTSPCVRVGWNDKVEIKRVLDLGAQTVVVPYVQSAEEARAAVEAIRYPPGGLRGVAGMSRASRFGAVEGYATTAEREICLILQVETEAALPQLEAIAGVDGVDGIFIGPADLAASLGYPGEPAHVEVKKAVIDATKRIRAAGKAPGFLSGDAHYCREVMEAGSLFLGIDIDIIALRRSVRERLALFRP